MIKIIKYFFQSFLIYFLFFIGRFLGLKISRKLFAYLFYLFGPLFKSKKVIKKNLKIFSQRINNLDEKKIMSSVWKNYGMTFIEYIFLDYFKKKNTIVTIKDNGNLSQIINDKKPVIFISGHFANFELMSMEITKKKIPLATIYRPLNNFFLNPFMEYLRKRYICPNQIRKGIIGTRKILSFLKEGTSIALMIDQRLSEGKKIPFFNKNASTTTLPAQLALKYDCNIVPVSIKRDSNDMFEMEILSPINITKESDVEKNKLEISLQLNKLLEKMVLNNPDQWIWTHNRWK